MPLDFSPFFDQYEVLAKAADQVFVQVQAQFPKEIECKLECSDCCHAMFDVTLVEALYLNYHFNKLFSGREREEILEKASRADRKTYKVKREAFRQLQEGKTETQIILEMAGERVRCPLLNEKNRCDLYAYRPITCRFYGVPTEIGGVSHTCGKSGFIKGKTYPTVHLEKMQRNLFALSHELAVTIQSRYAALGELLVPVSMALLTDYNEEYLGLKPAQNPDQERADNDERKDK